MKTSLHASLAALSAANALLASAAPIELRQDSDGFITFPGGGIRVCAFFPGWATAMVKPDFAAFEEGALRFRVSTVAPDGTGRIFYEISNSTPNKGAEKQ